tara:strand:+ start:4287 stop:4772 length:486 start_codon:yes stop_codon:yes gene_type:complete
MSIETRDSQNPETTENKDLSNCTVVDQITVEMILSDLAQGRNKEKIRQKYAYNDENGNPQPFEKWMVDEMFKDPNLRGKKPARKKVLPFSFKGTTETTKITMTADSNGSIEVKHTVSEEPKDSIPGTEGGHQMTVPTSNNGYVEINVEEDENEENTNQYNY